MSRKKTKNKVGRPLAFKSVKELQAKIDEYFKWCDDRTKEIYIEKTGSTAMISHPAPYTMSGLANRLGVDRDTIINYSHKAQYFGTIRAAREKVHEDVETRLMDTKNERGAIFNLKNNFGWKEKTETDLTSLGKALPTPILGGKTKES